MNLLAIETSTELATVALAIDAQLFIEESSTIRQHAQHLLPMIEQLFQQAQASLEDVEGIVYGRGPGSFTGIRIACSMAKGLAYAKDLPLYPVSSLRAIAKAFFMQKNYQLKDISLLSMIDARMQQVYWAQYTEDVANLPESVMAAADIDCSLEKPIIAAGVGIEPYLMQLPVDLRERIVETRTLYPRAETLIQLVREGKVKAQNVVDALPVYVRNQVTQGEPNG